MTISANFPQIAPSLDLDFANSVALDPRISYSRSTTGTYYDGQTSALAEQNLFIRSQDFSNATWVKNTGVTISGTLYTAPDGTTTANALVTSATNIQQYVYASTLVGPSITASVYAKANGYNYLQFSWGLGTDYANFFLSGAGSVSQSSGTSVYTITSVGNSWYRCTINTNFGGSSTSNLVLTVMQTGTETRGQTTTGDGVSGLLLWGAQIDTRSSAYPYTATTTAAITNYIPQLLTAPVNQPRFDFNPTTRQSLGLLMEQQSTNLVTYSSDYTQSVWTATNATVTASANISPDGTLDAQSLTDNSTNGLHNITQTKTLTATSYTFSIYAKAGSITYMKMSLATSGTNGVIFNLSTGAYVSNDAGFTYTTPQSVGNGWYRYSITFTGTAASYIAQVLLCSNSTTFSYAGTGQNAYFFGAQVEALAFPTSYIPTVASQVTRAQDFATMTGTNFSSWFNNQQGSVYCSFDTAGIGAPAMSYWAIDNNSSAGYYANRATGSSTLTVFQGSASASAGTISAVNTVQQNAYSYNNTSGSLAASGLLNGGSIGTITSVQLSYVPTQLSLGKHISNTSPMTGHIRKFAYYPIATTTAQMQAITGS